MSNTSIGTSPARDGNENHDGDPRHRTLGEAAPPDESPKAGEVLDEAAPSLPAGVPGGPAQPAVKKGEKAYPDGPNVEASPWELEAARGHLPGKASDPSSDNASDKSTGARGDG